MIDLRYDHERIRQFASVLDRAPESEQAFLRDLFGGNESPDFYHGMLAGLAHAFQMSEQEDALLGILVATVSDLIESKELV